MPRNRVSVDGLTTPVDVNTAANMIKSGTAVPQGGGRVRLTDPYGKRALGTTFFSGSAIKGSLTLPFAGRDDALLSYELLRLIARRSGVVKPPVDFVVRSLAGTPYRIRAVEGMRVPKKAIKQAEELFKQPLAEMGMDTFPDVLSKLMRDQMVLDQGIILKHRGAGGGMEAFECMDAATFLPIEDDKTGRLESWLQRLKSGKESDYPIGDVVNFIINRRSDSLFGEPPLESVIHETNAILNASRSFSKAMNDNEIPPGVLFLMGADNSRAMSRLEQQVRRDRGVANDYALKVIAGIERAQWVPFQRPYHEMQVAELLERLERIVFRVFGVDRIAMGSAQDVNRCHSADTEILTENGWKNYWDVLEGERIATMNPQTKALEFHVPNQMFLNSYQGKMLHFTGRQLDMVVTPNHRMWVRSGANSNRVGQGPSQYEFIEAGSLSAKHPYLMPVSFQADDQPDQDEFVLPGAKTFGGPNGDYPERVIEMDTFVRFIGYFVSEGHAGVHHGRYVVNLSQNTDSPYTSSMGQVISSVPAKFVARDDNQGVRRWVVSDKALNTWLRENCGELARSKKLPELWKTLSHRQLNLMYQALIDGDGTRSSRDNSKSVTYYTASKTLADQVQQVAMKLGHRAHVREHNYPGYENGYRVLITENTPESRIRNSVQEVDYDGKVFCFDVPPNHLMVTRRNGTVAITGNSTAEAMLMTRHFSLFKPLLDIWANKFTFEVLKEIHEGLFIEFIHFARTGMETDLIGVGPTGSISDEVMQAGPGGGDGGDDEKLFGGRALPCGGCNGHGYSTFYYNGQPDRVECPDCGGRGRGGPVFVSRPNHGRFAIPEGLNRMRNLRKNPSKAWEELSTPGMREKLRGATELTRRKLVSAAESVDSGEDMIVVGRMIRKSLGELFEAAYDTASEVARKAGVKVSRESLNNANTHVYDLVRFQVNRPVLNGADHQEVAIHAADDCAALCDLATQVAGSTLLDAVERAA